MSFILRTTSHVGTDHFAFGVRGKAADGPCSSNPPYPQLLDNPFWGRGLIIYPSANLVKFENFTRNCITGNGVTESTRRAILLQPNAVYSVEVWANHQNVWYYIERIWFNPQISNYEYIPVAYGDCLAHANSTDDVKCASRPENGSSANRVFIANTQDLLWSVDNWHIY